LSETAATTPRRICVVLVDRANYGRLKPVMGAIHAHRDLDLQVAAAGTMVLERFDRPVDLVRADGFPVSAEVYMELEGSTPMTMAKSVGFGIVEFANELQRLRPDFVLVIGDRYEALSATIAAAFMNIPVVHLQGGEVSGSIDESNRHAITKFAHYHFPATRRSADYLVRMGEDPATVLGVGCPSSDIARSIDRQLHADVVNARGSGIEIDVDQPYLLVVFHPTTTDYGSESSQMQALLRGLDELRIQTLLLWPNIDAGADHISKTIRMFRDHMDERWLRLRTNLSPEDYLRVLANTACAVGNSSSFVRDSSFFGTPIVLVGDRQEGRESAENVVTVPPIAERIAAAVQAQLEHGPFAPSTLYGDGFVSEALANALATIDPYVQKRLAFVGEDVPMGAIEGIAR
jgi:UDP-hydrolysing UDP-N-acetyl-D-glucosamine 2-epimerase